MALYGIYQLFAMEDNDVTFGWSFLLSIHSFFFPYRAIEYYCLYFRELIIVKYISNTY